MPSPPGRVLCVPSSPLNKERSPHSVQSQSPLLSLQPSHTDVYMPWTLTVIFGYLLKQPESSLSER